MFDGLSCSFTSLSVLTVHYKCYIDGLSCTAIPLLELMYKCNV